MWSVTQSCPTLCSPMDCTPPGSSVYGIFQARTLAISYSRRSSLFRDRTCITWGSCIGKWILYHWCYLRSPMLSAINFKIFYTYLCMHTHTHTYTEYGKLNNCWIFEVYGSCLHHPINFTVFLKLVKIISGSWWWTGRPGVLQFMGLQRVTHDWTNELNWTVIIKSCGKENWEKRFVNSQ